MIKQKRMKKSLLWTGGTLLGIVLLLTAWMFWNLRDRNPGYEVDLDIKGSDEPGTIKVGFAAFPVTPEIVDTWNDVNGDDIKQPNEGEFWAVDLTGDRDSVYASRPISKWKQVI